MPGYPCEQFAVTLEEAKGVNVYTPCKIDGKSNVQGMPGFVPPTSIKLPPTAKICKGCQALHVIDADKDGLPDLLIVADDSITGSIALFLSFSRGDGRFHSTPEKGVPADGKAPLYPARTLLAQP